MITALYVGFGLLLILVALPMIFGKVPPNRWYGFRTNRTLANQEIWYPANSYSGKLLLAAGAVISLAAIILALIPGLSANAYAIVMVVVLTAAVLLAVVGSLRYLRSL